jgi:hypothetical protein
MAALDQFLVSNPDMVEKSYGDVIAACLVGRSNEGAISRREASKGTALYARCL